MSLLIDLQLKDILDNCELVRVKLGNGNMAACLRLKGSDCQVILKEFRGEYQYRKFCFEAFILRAFTEFDRKKKILTVQTLSNFYKFLSEKDKLNNDKIV